MTQLSESIQNADWKTEKHVPVIECPDSVNANQFFEVAVTVGKTVSHPNTTEHHIRWIKLLFIAEGEKTVYEMGNIDFAAHGESAKGANQGPAYANPAAKIFIKISKSGTLQALSFCNIHGLWESSKVIKVT
ncbi:MAG: class II SORL domain-containing protein [Kiritimatiellae bacterium]|nr:class II SORL domain-containing protein [Kiritimatiellia bacterium]MDD5522534.1 class II SORL domain-containing protein [Kiritimatiellia bacterium]